MAASHVFAYDAAGNVRRSLANYHQIDAQGYQSSSSQTTQDYWYRYDAMNRMVTAKGELSGGAITRGSYGADITYNLAGERAYTIDSVPGGATRRDDYVYDSAGRLSEVKSGTNLSSPGTKRADYTYDTMGRITLQRDYDTDGTSIVYSRSVTYNDKSQVTGDVVLNKRGSNNFYEATAAYDYGAGTSYALGAALVVTTANRESTNGGASWTAKPTTSMTNTYAWWDGAVLSSTSYDRDTSVTDTLWTSTYTNIAVGGQAQLQKVSIADGRPRKVNFVTDLFAQVIWRGERDNTSGGDPHEIWYRFSGRQIGYVGNNGTLDTDYNTSIANRTAVQGTGAFFNGAVSVPGHADFDLAYDSTNSYTQGSTRGVYVVQAGDTLSSIAAALWGDASLWWKLAEVNGLTAESALPEGLPLIIPAGVIVHHNNALTYQPYDPLEVLGNTSPTAPKPAARAGGCGGAGTIVLAVIAIAVAAIVAPYATGAISALQGGAGLGAAHGAGLAALSTVSSGTALTVGGSVVAASTGVATTITATGIVAGGAVAGAAASIVSQGIGVATGIQDKFSWNAVALAAIGGAVGARAGISGLDGVARAVVSNVVTQGIGVATGLQKEFSWAGVAAAGVGAWAGRAAAGLLPGDAESFVYSTVRHSADAIASAAARTLIEGSDFGDNMLAALPTVIGSVVGDMISMRAGPDEAQDGHANAAMYADGWRMDSEGRAYRIGLPGGDHGYSNAAPGRRRWYEIALDWLGADGNFGNDGTRWGDFAWRGPGRAVRGAIDNWTDSEAVVVIAQAGMRAEDIYRGAIDAVNSIGPSTRELVHDQVTTRIVIGARTTEFVARNPELSARAAPHVAAEAGQWAIEHSPEITVAVALAFIAPEMMVLEELVGYSAIRILSAERLAFLTRQPPRSALAAPPMARSPNLRFVPPRREGAILPDSVTANMGGRRVAGAPTTGASPEDAYYIRIDPAHPGRPDPQFSIDTRTFTNPAPHNANGFPVDARQFWAAWMEQNPQTISGRNRFLIEDRRLSPEIDDIWIQHFPEHGAYIGDSLRHHHVEGGPYAIPVPGSTHQGSEAIWHRRY